MISLVAPLMSIMLIRIEIFAFKPLSDMIALDQAFVRHGSRVAESEGLVFDGMLQRTPNAMPPISLVPSAE